MVVRLRPYQIEINDAIERDLDDGHRRLAAVAPCGTGKTVVLSDLITRRAPKHGGQTVVVAHTDELINQTAIKFRGVTGQSVGVVKAGQDETDAPVIVSSIQTLSRPNRRERLRNVGFLIIDECHLAAAPSYVQTINHFDVPTVGFTATLARGDGKALGEVWKKVSVEIPLLRMIRQGYLADIEGVQVKIPDLDLSGLKKTAGDYRDGELGERLQDSMAPETVAKAYREHGVRADGTVRPGILFAPTVATAQLFAEVLCAEGFKAVAVWGNMSRDERHRILGHDGKPGAYDRGEYDILTSVSMLSIGFDSPRAEVAIIARPTQSAPLYIQQVGRVLRPYPGKGRALVLDVVGAAARHELCTLATLAGERLEEVKESETLLKALDELETEESEAEESSGYVGPVQVVKVDLFAGRRQQWLQTHAGHWFIPAGDRIIALVPDKADALDVAWLRTTGKGGGYIARSVGDLGIAMAHGEEAITEDEELMADKDRAWRKRKMTERQVNYARGLGIKVDALSEKTRAGQLGDLISIALASRRIDTLVSAKRG